ncbi:MAG TPA: helix-turn-helix transcriptional regulator [Cyclobacteriaceae bacterium]|nr:helix-turn-helix transcriptional regulator [Cyclobacteriaceae bacterium]
MIVAPGNIQNIFLDEVKKRVPSNISFADDLSEILSISRDSAYRRIRGETVLSLDEVKLICNHYGVSLDALLSTTSNTVTFRYQAVDEKTFAFESWMKSILANLEMIHAVPEKELFYSAKDVPVFYHFDYPDLTAFKIYFWNKTVLGASFQEEKFNPKMISNDLISLAKRIWQKYAALPSTEFWSEETTNITLRQIEFTYDCGFFANPDDAKILLEQYCTMLSNVRKWAAAGIKNSTGESFKLYKNEIMIADNTIFFKMGAKRISFVVHNGVEYLTTSQENYCLQTEKYLTNLLNKAVLISTTGEKERNRFFNSMDEKASALKKKIQ